MIDAFSTYEDGRWHHTYLSNGFIEPDGTFVEREYQGYKTLDPEWRRKIMECEQPFGPYGSKRLGRAAPLRPDFAEVQFPLMAHFVNKKFRDHLALEAKLKGTGVQMLVEGNHWHDNTWGDCRCGNKDGGHPECLLPGSNWLGLILMTVRATL